MSTLAKPVIPQAVAESIERLRAQGWSDDDFFQFWQYDEECPDARLLYHYFRRHRAVFAAAIINGFEVVRGA